MLLAGMLSAFPARESKSKSIVRAYGKRPLLFEQHQAADGAMAQFSAHASGRKLLFSASGAFSEWSLGAGASDPQPEIAMRLIDARPDVAPRAVGMQVGGANYLVGPRPDQWRTGVPLFGKIMCADVYPGIDLIYYGNQHQLEYDFVVAPGASWRSIRMAFSGAQAVEIDPHGDLKLQTRWGWLRHRRPRVYQQLASGRREISGHYVLYGDRQVGFEIGAYDPAVALVIDPTLVYSSYLGGSATDYGYSVAVDSSGCAYTVGETWSTNFPLLNSRQSVQAGDTDIFVTKWNAAGTGILYSTYIGGSNRDVPLSIVVDATGNAHITGYTYSANFPITSGALRSTFSGQSKAFVLELNPSGNSLIYSTFLGGSGNDYATGIAVDATGQAYISGYTASIDFPVSSNAFQSSYGGGEFDGFFAKLNAAGSQLVYATYLGGIGNDTAYAVALDPARNVYLTGQTQSSNFPVLQALQTTYNESDAFVVKLNASSQVLYSTYLGGTGSSTGTGIAADASGNAYVAGYTTAPDFPVTAGAYQSGNHGSYDAFVAKLSANGSTILNATYFGGSGSESASGIALDSSGDVFVSGSTNSMDLPLQAPVQATYSGGGDAFLAAFNNQLSNLYLSTYYGGAESETGAGIAVDSSGNAYLIGSSDSGASTLGIPVTAGAFEISGRGSFDAFLAKFSFSGISLTCSASSPAPLNIPAGGAAEQVGDLVLTCTGGAVGPTVVTEIQLTLNGNVASGVQPELLIDNPPPSSQVPNVNLFLGSVNGSSSILFSGVSFPVPGPAAVHLLRITDVLVVAATIPSPGQVVATVSALSSSPPFAVIQPQQIVATADVQLQGFVMSASAAPANCVAPPAVTTFPASASQALLWFAITGAAAGDVIRTDWYAPGGILYQSSTLDAGAGSGLECFWDTLNIAGLSTLMSGAWQVNTYWNNAPLFSAPFSISAVGVTQLAVTITASPSGASITVAGSGCAPGSYITPATLTWSAGATCTISFTDPLTISGLQYEFQSSTVNGSAVSHTNPLTVNSGGGALLINAVFSAVSDIGPGTATHFSVTAPSNATAGIPIQFTVTALNSSNNTATTYSDPVHFTSTDPMATLPADATLTNGVGTFSASPVTPGAVSLTASDLLSPSVTGTSGSIAVSQSTSGLRFIAMPPCRVFDTRDATRPAGFGPPSLSAGATRSFSLPNGACGIPANAQAYSLNVTVVPDGPLGYLTAWPTGQIQPVASTLNSPEGEVQANATIVAAGTGGAISVFATNNTDLVLDINGYFVPNTVSNGLGFYPMTPCRLVDTRPGAPSTVVTGELIGGTSTTLPILSSTCGVPATAQAYSLNLTLVPPGPVSYLTVYPTGESLPLVSTLNDPTGTVQANAAIAPAGTGGSIEAFVTQTTNLVVDINGYFAPMGEGALSLYALPPCRVLDTRTTGAPFEGAINVNVIGSGCGVTSAAQAYVFNATVVPQGSLGYLTLWPQGGVQPVVSTLNAYDGEVSSNMAIVPTSNTEIGVYATNDTHLILDMFGYFAP